MTQFRNEENDDEDEDVALLASGTQHKLLEIVPQRALDIYNFIVQ